MRRVLYFILLHYLQTIPLPGNNAEDGSEHRCRETTFLTCTRGKNPNELQLQVKDHASGFAI
jgi:hypothetical protein